MWWLERLVWKKMEYYNLMFSFFICDVWPLQLLLYIVRFFIIWYSNYIVFNSLICCPLLSQEQAATILKLEHVIHLKDIRIEDLTTRLEKAGVSYPLDPRDAKHKNRLPKIMKGHPSIATERQSKLIKWIKYSYFNCHLGQQITLMFMVWFWTLI